MADHLHQAAAHTQFVEDEEAQGHETHVGDGRISHQLLHVLLNQGHQADVDHRDQRQGDHEPGPLAAGVRGDRHGKAQEAVGTQLQHDGRQHHRSSGGRFHVGVGQPGMHRPHRHLHRKGREEGEEEERLGIQRQRQLVPGLDVETATRLEVQVDQRHQHQQRAQERVEEELESRVHATWPPPHTDDDVHRDQRGLKEHVEQQAVERREHAHHQTGEDQERAHVLVDTLGDDLPAGDDHDDGDKGREQDEPDRDAIHPEVVMHIEAVDPGQSLDELHAGCRHVKARGQGNGDQEGRQGTHQGHPPHDLRVLVTARGKQQCTHRHRQPDGHAQKTH